MVLTLTVHSQFGKKKQDIYKKVSILCSFIQFNVATVEYEARW